MISLAISILVLIWVALYSAGYDARWLALVGGASVVLYLLLRGSKPGHSEPYGSFHLGLNVRPGMDRSPPQTEWLNMGYWKVPRPEVFSRAIKTCRLSHTLVQNSSTFTDACEGAR